MGARLGILMLDTQFPRIPGDVGNADTWPFPVRYHVVQGATPQAIVCNDPEPFVQDFIAAGHDLIAQGCTGIATTCGFLALIRPRLSQALGVPVAASALEQAAQVQSMLPPDQRLGILTISRSSLTRGHLDAAGVPGNAAVHGLDHSGFAAPILGNCRDLDVQAAKSDMINAARSLVDAAPDIGAIILECTNMAPYANDISRAVQRPVYSIVSYLGWFHAGLVPMGFPPPRNQPLAKLTL